MTVSHPYICRPNCSREFPNLSHRNRSLHSPHRANIRASRYGSGEIKRMNTSKFTNGNGSGTAPSAKIGQPNAVRPEAKRTKRVVEKKAETEPPRTKVIKGGKSEKLVCRYCGSNDLAPSFIKRRDRRCRKCFSKRYGSAVSTKKAKVKK